MASGYRSVMYRLSGLVPSDQPGPDTDIEILKNTLKAYVLDDSLDDVSVDLCFQNFAIPALLTALHDFVSSDPHRIRLNEYFYRRLSQELPADQLHDAVFGAMALVVDAGSLNVSMEVDHLESFMYDLFPGLEDFLRMVSPTENPFVSVPINLDVFAEYLSSFQVCFLVFSCL